MSRAHELPGGACFALPLAAGESLTMTSTSSDTNVTMLLFAADRLDRLNAPDTMKAQMSSRITAPMVLMSDRGCALASVVESTVAHDCLAGMSHDRHVDAFGATSYAEVRNERRISARSGLLLELAKYGLGEADLHAPVNWFSTVVVEEDSARITGLRGRTPAERVVLRADLDILAFLSTAIHPLATSPATGGVRLEVAPYAGADPSSAWREESARALEMSAWARKAVPA